MNFSNRSFRLRVAMLLAAMASQYAFGFDYSAQIAQQQQEAARQASQRAQQMQNEQRMADMRRATEQAQMRQSNLRNEAIQEELRKSRDKVYGLDQAVKPAAPTPQLPAPPGPSSPQSTNDNAGRAAAAKASFPAQSVWADFPSQRVVAFQQDGTFRLFFPQNDKILKLVGRYEVDGQSLRMFARNKVETFHWAVGNVADQSGRAVARLSMSNAQAAVAWVACPACPN